MRINYKVNFTAGLLFLFLVSACKKFVEIDPPRTDLIKETVFTNNATANAAMLDIYFKMAQTGFACGDIFSVSYCTALSSDEIISYDVNSEEMKQFNQNGLVPTNFIANRFWNEPYLCIYKANSIIEGLAASTSISPALKVQLEGEAKFIRAFCHFYLLNLFGDVPLVLTTDYRANTVSPRIPATEVYQQIAADLQDAQALLPADYAFAGNDRIRPNKWAATALLARVYLYTAEWAKAEAQSSAIINNTADYSLVTDLDKVFYKNSREAIWQLEPRSYPGDLFSFYIFGTEPGNGALRDPFAQQFEAGDQRRASWISSVTSGANTWYFPVKYKSFTQKTEYSTVFRLAEQLLIRAEARTKLGKVTGPNSAESDINAIRNRALLGNTTANTQELMLTAIEKERRFELFTEWGHRWFDLKRTNQANVILAPVKTSNWQATDVLYPIPESQLLNSPVSQNDGY